MRYLLIIACLILAAPVQARTIVGPAKVTDGDTLMMDDAKVRLFGIDAPELDLTCNAMGGTGRADRKRRRNSHQ